MTVVHPKNPCDENSLDDGGCSRPFMEKLLPLRIMCSQNAMTTLSENHYVCTAATMVYLRLFAATAWSSVLTRTYRKIRTNYGEVFPPRQRCRFVRWPSVYGSFFVYYITSPDTTVARRLEQLVGLSVLPQNSSSQYHDINSLYSYL